MSTITSSQEQQVIDQVPKRLFIAGEWRGGAEGTLLVEDPATGEALCEVADASVDDARAALDAAVECGWWIAASQSQKVLSKLQELCLRFCQRVVVFLK